MHQYIILIKSPLKYDGTFDDVTTKIELQSKDVNSKVYLVKTTLLRVKVHCRN